jgi:hypothetical protein
VSEMEKDFERLEDEKFRKLSKNCPWKHKKCPNEYICPCLKHECAIWYFVKALTE